MHVTDAFARTRRRQPPENNLDHDVQREHGLWSAAISLQCRALSPVGLKCVRFYRNPLHAGSVVSSEIVCRFLPVPGHHSHFPRRGAIAG